MGRRAFSLYLWSLFPQASTGHHDQQRTPGLQPVAEERMREKNGICIQHFSFSEGCLRNWFLSYLTWSTDGIVWYLWGPWKQGRAGAACSDTREPEMVWRPAWLSVIGRRHPTHSFSPLGRREKSGVYIYPTGQFFGGTAQRTGFCLNWLWNVSQHTVDVWKPLRIMESRVVCRGSTWDLEVERV